MKSCLAAVLLLVMLTGCGEPWTGRAAGLEEPAEAGVWGFANETWAVMIQLARDEPDLAGSLDEVELSGSGRTEVESTHAAFTGTVDGSSIVLTFPLGLGFVTSLSGTWSDDAMTLNVPQDNGVIGTVTLKPSSRAAYNRAVDAIRAVAATNSQVRASASEAAAEQAARLDAERKITEAAVRVTNSVGGLATATHANPGWADFEAALSAAKKAVAEAQRYADQAAGESDEYAACSHAYSARSAAYTAESAGYSGDSAASTVTSKIQEVDDLVAAVTRAMTDYRTVLAQLPGYTPPVPPDEQAVKRALDEAATQVSAWRGKSADFQGKIADQVKRADAIADKAEQQFC